MFRTHHLRRWSHLEVSQYIYPRPSGILHTLAGLQILSNHAQFMHFCYKPVIDAIVMIHVRPWTFELIRKKAYKEILCTLLRVLLFIESSLFQAE